MDRLLESPGSHCSQPEAEPSCLQPSGDSTLFTEWSYGNLFQLTEQAAQLPHLQSNDLTHLKCSKYESGTEPAGISLEPRRSWAGFSWAQGISCPLVIIPSSGAAPSQEVCSQWNGVGRWLCGHECAHTWKLFISGNVHCSSSLRRASDYKLVKLTPCP